MINHGFVLYNTDSLARLIVWTDVFDFIASAIAIAPLSPISFPVEKTISTFKSANNVKNNLKTICVFLLND